MIYYVCIISLLNKFFGFNLRCYIHIDDKNEEK